MSSLLKEITEGLGESTCCMSMLSCSDSGENDWRGELTTSPSHVSLHIVSGALDDSSDSSGKYGLRRSINCGFGPDTGRFRFFRCAFKSDTFIFSSLATSEAVVGAVVTVTDSLWLGAGLDGIEEATDKAGDGMGVEFEGWLCTLPSMELLAVFGGAGSMVRFLWRFSKNRNKQFCCSNMS